MTVVGGKNRLLKTVSNTFASAKSSLERITDLTKILQVLEGIVIILLEILLSKLDSI